MSPEKGPCNMNRQRWYYDDGSNSCKKFTFGGCNGNRNNFPSKQSCEERCKGNVKQMWSKLISIHMVFTSNLKYVCRGDRG